LTLLLVLAVAWLTNFYFGTLNQAIVRLASFLLASHGLLFLAILGLQRYGDLSVGIIVLLGCLGALFWLFVAVFHLDPAEMLVTFKIVVLFAVALAFQSLVIVGLRTLLLGGVAS
jgi:hypothetical protein